MSQPAELVEFVKDSLRNNIGPAEIRSALISEGWPAHQVSEAMGGYERLEFGIPIPNSRSKSRPNAWFFGEISTFASEVFQIVEWIAVAVVVRYAAAKTESVVLHLLVAFLLLLLTGHVVSRWLNFEWWLWPDLDRRGIRGLRKAFHLLFSLVAMYGLYTLVVTTVDLLLLVQDAS